MLDGNIIERRGSYDNCVDGTNFVYTKTISIPEGVHELLVETTSSAIPKDLIIQTSECYESIHKDVYIPTEKVIASIEGNNIRIVYRGIIHLLK